MSVIADADLGPRSLLWRWAGDRRIGFLAPSIGLLQVMHPGIGAAVGEHSGFFEDPYGRVFRTARYVLDVVYQDAGDEEPGRRVRDFHRDIRGVDGHGRSYHALRPETYWWAHATFQYMVEQVADRFDRHRLSAEERERLYQEGLAWYARYGVSDRTVPPDRAAFQESWDHYCTEVLEMNEVARRVLELIEDHDATHPLPAEAAYRRPLLGNAASRRALFVPLRLAAVGGLPAVVRERFDIRWTRRDQLALDTMALWVRHGWWVLPTGWRWEPQALEGWRRAGVRPGRSPAAVA